MNEGRMRKGGRKEIKGIGRKKKEEKKEKKTRKVKAEKKEWTEGWW